MAVVIQRPENFPETVKEVRQQPALSQEELAHELGLGFASINRWENSKTAPSKLALRQFDAFCEKIEAQGKSHLENSDE